MKALVIAAQALCMVRRGIKKHWRATVLEAGRIAILCIGTSGMLLVVFGVAALFNVEEFAAMSRSNTSPSAVIMLGFLFAGVSVCLALFHRSIEKDLN